VCVCSILDVFAKSSKQHPHYRSAPIVEFVHVDQPNWTITLQKLYKKQQK
jgi:hypothetical protein